MKKRLVVFLLVLVAWPAVLFLGHASGVKNPVIAEAVKMYHVFAEVTVPCYASPIHTQLARGYSARIGVGDATWANIRGGTVRERIDIVAHYVRVVEDGEYGLFGTVDLFEGHFNWTASSSSLDSVVFVVDGNRREFALSGERFRYLDQPTMLEILGLLENAETAEIFYEKKNGEKGKTPLTGDDLCRANKILQMWRDKKPISLE